MRIRMWTTTLLAFGMMSAVKAQPTSDSFAALASGDIAFLLANKTIQDELKMTEAEIDKVRNWTKEFRDKATQIKKDKGIDFSGKGLGSFTQAMSKDQEKWAAANSEIRKVSYKELVDILRKAQIERLKQIDFQRMGVSAFRDDEVITSLKLTEAQIAVFKKLDEGMEKDTMDLVNDALKSKQGVEKIQELPMKTNKLRKDYYDKAIATLTDDQSKKWKEMIGKPFDLEKLRSHPTKKKD